MKGFTNLKDACVAYCKLYPARTKYLNKFPERLEHCDGTEVVEVESRLTESELAICKAIGAAYVTRDQISSHVSLWSILPNIDCAFSSYERYIIPEEYVHAGDPDQYMIARVPTYLFSSVQRG